AIARTPLALLAHAAGSRASPVLSSVGGGEALFGGSGSNGDSRLQRPLSCHWTTPDRHPPEHGPGLRRGSGYPSPPARFPPGGHVPTSLTGAMGSLIKKRRKRMRKKKHKKMLKATRWQRRSGK